MLSLRNICEYITILILLILIYDDFNVVNINILRF